MGIQKNRIRLIFVLLVGFLFASGAAEAQVIRGKPISIGGVFGDPSGVSMRYPLGLFNALDVGFGPDYFGSPRLQIDYVWEFHAFDSSTIDEYFGPGLAIAFAKGINSFYTKEPHRESFASSEDNGFNVGGRAIFGMEYAPKASPLEFFLESGPLIPMGHIFEIDLDGAVGLRYKL